jgi:hypothetical protein
MEVTLVASIVLTDMCGSDTHWNADSKPVRP